MKNKLIDYEQYLLIKSVMNCGVRTGINLVKESLAKEIDAIDDECETRNISVVEVLKDWKGAYIR
tara:strand:+ start:79 stop:273 length:195 start_codon:yes stop_codon:yes gene_type:complete